jgi:selenocysteine lyase/cysteine desulfurase
MIAPPVDRPAYDLDAWRRTIPILVSAVPMCHCSHSPQMERTRAAAEEYLASWRRDGMDWERWMAEVEAARAAFAALIGASPEEVALATSVSAATASLASAMVPAGRRRRVLTTAAEFPSVGQVWMAAARYGLELDRVPLAGDEVDEEGWEERLDERTLLVSASHAYYQNGALLDLATVAERAHRAGAWLYVDAYQTLGVVPLDVRALGVDFLAAGALKYLLGIPGIAFLYVRRELIAGLAPAVTGWFGRRDPFAFRADLLDWADTAARFDTGTPPVAAAYVARAGMEVIREVGPERIRPWTLVLSQRLLEGGAERGLAAHGPRDPRRKTPSTAFLVEDSAAVEAALRQRGVLASARGPAIRLAPHFYNTPEDVDRALEALVRVVGR